MMRRQAQDVHIHISSSLKRCLLLLGIQALQLAFASKMS